MTEDDVRARVAQACTASGTSHEEAQKLACDFVAAIAPIIVLCPVCFNAGCKKRHRDRL